jgi:hypothetical protein
VFAEEVQPFKKLRDQGWDRKYKIGFCNSVVEAAFKKLLQHSCRVCTGKTEFRTFGALKDHMRREHELFYCDLCVDNLKVLNIKYILIYTGTIAHRQLQALYSLVSSFI